jgi:wee1-like protein kinase
VYALAALSDQADTANFHIVRYHQAWMEDDRLFIQTELCVGTLRDEISGGVITSEKRQYKLLREMLLALDFIHRNNMVHLDIKPDNIFIKNDQYKLGDFGLVTKLSASQDVEEGDSRYMSLELLSGDKSDLRKSDIFSLGATLYEICLERPLAINGEEWSDIRADKLAPLRNTSEDLAAVIRQMMNPVPADRPIPLELLRHPQLLSEEQKALNAAKSKVAQATMQLVAQEQRFQRLGPTVARRGLTRANTWNGSTFSL